MNRNRFLIALAGLLVVIAAALGFSWARYEAPGSGSEAEIAAAREAALRRACGSNATYDRLKELAFDEAARIRRGDPRDLDAIAANAVVRMERPVPKSRDETLNVTVCAGRFILELPPGAENAFDGERRLTADITYSAQAAADGSGLVYQMDGAEPIIYRLATIGMGSGAPETAFARAGVPPPPRTAPEPVRDPVSAEAPPPEVRPNAERTPRSAPPPTRAPVPPPEPRAKTEPQPKAEARTIASPSFNCRHARTRSERMVCASPSLAARDRAMSSLFYSALADGAPATRSALRASRDRFLAFRERCGSEACVAQAYEDRIREIRDIASGDY